MICSVNIRQLKELVRCLLRERFPRALFVFGPPGIGKSQAIHQVAREESVGCTDLRLAQCDPTDLRGVLVYDPQDKSARWVVCSALPRDGRGILFLDEINLAPPSVQAAAYQLILDRRVGDYQLPEGWMLVAAGNRIEDRANIYKLPAPLANRFVHVQVAPDLNDWKKWAFENGVHPSIVAFLNFKPELFCRVPQQIKDDVFPTPRTWEFVSDLIKCLHDPALLEEAVKGAVGEGPGIEFMAFYALDEESRRVLDAIQRGEDAVARELSLQFLINGYLVDRLRKDPAFGPRVLEYSLRLEPEQAVVLLRDALSVDGEMLKHPRWSEVAHRFGKYVL